MDPLILESISGHIKENEIIRSSQHGFIKGKSCSTNLVHFCDEMTDMVDEGRAVDNVYLDFSNAFDTFSHKIITKKLLMCGLDEQTVRCIETWMNGCAQRVLISSTKSSQRSITSGVPQSPVLFNICIKDLDDGAEYTLSKFADDTKLGGVADTPESHAVTQRNLERLEKWADRNFIKVNKGKCNVLHPGKKNPRHQHVLMATQLESSFAEKDQGILVDTKLNMNQQCILAAKKVNGILGWQSIASRWRDVMLPLFSLLMRPCLENHVNFWAPQYKEDMDIPDRVQQKATKTVKGLGTSLLCREAETSGIVQPRGEMA